MGAKLAAGWRFGETKDPDKKTHPSLVPFGQLTEPEQAKDFLFSAVANSAKLALASDEPEA